jgi:hydrogenase-1 operon protein HyaF
MNSGRPESPCAGARTGNVRPLLSELEHALARLLATGEETSIDLRRLPLTAADEAELDEFFGRGEIHAMLDLMGSSEIHETRFAGIWRAVHHNVTGELMGKYLLVTYCPEILATPVPDVERAIAELRDELGPPASNAVPVTGE